MISIPNFLFKLLSWIPLVGGAFKRSSFELMFTDQFVVIPIIRFVEAFFRLIILTSLIFAAFFVYRHFIGSEPEPMTQQELIQSFDLDEEQFQEVLKDNKGEQFMEVIDLIADDPTTGYESRIRRLDNRILAAGKIAKSRLSQQKVFGLTKEIELRLDRAFFNLENETYDAESIKELLELGRLYKSVQFPIQTKESDALIDRAKLGEIVAQGVQFVETCDVEKDTYLSNQLLENTSQITEQFLSKGEIGTQLTRLSDLARIRLEQLDKSTKFCDQLDSLLVSMASKNANSRISDLAKMDCLTVGAETLAYLPGEEATYKDKFVAEFHDKLQQVLEVDKISAKDHSVIITKLNQIAEAGWPLEAQDMLDKLNSTFPLNADQTVLQKQIATLESRLNWIGKEVSIQGIQTLTNRDPNFHNSNALATVFVYISMVKIHESETRIKQLGRVYNNVFKNATLDFVIVFMHEDDKRNGLQAMRVANDRMKQVDYWQMNVNSDYGKVFLQQLSIEDTPLTLILDRNRRVVALNPNANRATKILDSLRIRELAK